MAHDYIFDLNWYEDEEFLYQRYAESLNSTVNLKSKTHCLIYQDKPCVFHNYTTMFICAHGDIHPDSKNHYIEINSEPINSNEYLIKLEEIEKAPINFVLSACFAGAIINNDPEGHQVGTSIAVYSSDSYTSVVNVNISNTLSIINNSIGNRFTDFFIGFIFSGEQDARYLYVCEVKGEKVQKIYQATISLGCYTKECIEVWQNEQKDRFAEYLDDLAKCDGHEYTKDIRDSIIYFKEKSNDLSQLIEGNLDRAHYLLFISYLNKSLDEVVIDWDVRLKQIIDYFYNSSSSYEFDLDPLFIACGEGNLEAVKTLLEYGANPNAVMINDGDTALAIAYREGNLEVVKTLLEYGANPNVANLSGITAIDIAKDNDDIGMFKILKQKIIERTIEKRMKKEDVSVAKIKINEKDFFINYGHSESKTESLLRNQIKIDSSLEFQTSKGLAELIGKYCIDIKSNDIKLYNAEQSDCYQIKCEESIFDTNEMGYCQLINHATYDL